VSTFAEFTLSEVNVLSVNSANQSRDSGIDSVPFAESILSEAEGLRASTNSFPDNTSCASGAPMGMKVRETPHPRLLPSGEKGRLRGTFEAMTLHLMR